jgi:hypothetical protein
MIGRKTILGREGECRGRWPRSAIVEEGVLQNCGCTFHSRQSGITASISVQDISFIVATAINAETYLTAMHHALQVLTRLTNTSSAVACSPSQSEVRCPLGNVGPRKNSVRAIRNLS